MCSQNYDFSKILFNIRNNLQKKFETYFYDISITEDFSLIINMTCTSGQNIG